MATPKLTPKYQVWIDARKRYHLSDMHIQMARELNLNPQKLGQLVNRDKEKGKESLQDHIETLYHKNYHTDRPDVIRSIEQVVQDKKRKRSERKSRKREYVGTKGGDSTKNPSAVHKNESDTHHCEK